MIVALARTLLAQRARARYLDADNLCGDWAEIGDAATSGRAWFGTVAPDVLAYDLDEQRAVEAADSFANELAAAEVPFLLAESGRPGHRHLWAVVPDPIDREHWRDRGDELGLPKPRQAMRPPLTPHRSGLPVAVVYPGSGDDELHELLADVGAARRRSRGEREPLRWRELLRTGRWPKGWHGDRTGSALTWHICIGAAREGLTVEHVDRLLCDPDLAGGAAYRSRLVRSRTTAEQWLRQQVWPAAIERANRPAFTCGDDARADLDRIRQAIDLADWSGQAGATDRAVLLALVERGYQWGTIQPNMSHREVAEAAPCHRNTAAASLRRHRAAGWLQIVRRGSGRTVRGEGTAEHMETADGTVWRLLVPRQLAKELDQALLASGELRARLCATGGTPPPRTGAGGTKSRALLDACRWRGLGLNAPRVLDALEAEPLTSHELADQLGLSWGNLRHRLLPKLEEHQLVKRDLTGRYQLAADVDELLEVAAEALGLAGKTEAVAAQHARERAEYLEHRADARPRRSERSRDRIRAWDRQQREKGLERLPDVAWDELAEPSSAPPGRREPRAVTRSPGAQRNHETAPQSYADPVTGTAAGAQPQAVSA